MISFILHIPLDNFSSTSKVKEKVPSEVGESAYSALVFPFSSFFKTIVALLNCPLSFAFRV